MGTVWLGSLPQVLRDAGLAVSTWPGWETRSRSTGGYEDVRGIGVHHDAIGAGTSLEARCRSAWDATWNPNRPVGALWLHTDGRWMVGAAGATNTQGRGHALKMSRGWVPENRGNLYFLSIEASNNGVGEPWPTVQQDSYVRGCAALCEWLGLHSSDVLAHFETAPGRKIDPTGPSRFAQGRTMWHMPGFRSEVANIREQDDEMRAINPQRIMDTRERPYSAMTPGQGRHEFGIDPATSVPSTAKAVAVTFTITGSTGSGFVSTAGPGEPIGGSSILNLNPGLTLANTVFPVKVVDGRFSVQVFGSRDAATHLICDVVGYV